MSPGVLCPLFPSYSIIILDMTRLLTVSHVSERQTTILIGTTTSHVMAGSTREVSKVRRIGGYKSYHSDSFPNLLKFQSVWTDKVLFTYFISHYHELLFNFALVLFHTILNIYFSSPDNMLGNIEVPSLYTAVTPKSFIPPSPLRTKQFVMPLKLQQVLHAK